MGNARNRNPCPESAPAPSSDAPTCRVCSRPMPEDTLRTVCLPCAMKAQQDADLRRHREDVRAEPSE